MGFSKEMQNALAADGEKLRQLTGEDHGPDFFDEDWPVCPTCKGRRVVNPLTAPEGFFCVGSIDCPTCDGSGDCP